MKRNGSNQAEWDRWTVAWRASDDREEAASDARWRAEILRSVRRQTGLMALGVVVQFTIAAAFSALAVHLVSGDPGPFEWVTAIAIWSLVLIALGAAASGERGLWRPAGDSTRDFVDLSLRRARNRLRNLRWGIYLLVLEVAFFVPWIWWLVRSRPAETVTWVSWAGPYGLLALLVGVFAIAIALLHQQALRRLRWLERLERELLDQPA